MIPQALRAIGPRYWKDETGGELAVAIRAYLLGREMTAAQVKLMRLYLTQWVDAPVWNANPYGQPGELDGLRDAVRSVTNPQQIKCWIARALALGIDPL